MNAIGINAINKRTVEIEVYEGTKRINKVRVTKKRDTKLLKKRMRLALRVAGRLTYLAFMGLCTAFVLWIFISWVNVISNNLSPDGEIASWNAFQVLVDSALFK